MARVVARQKQIPYLLIVFVFLFVISTVLAVMAFMEKDELLATIDKLESVKNALASDAQLLDEKTDLPIKMAAYRKEIATNSSAETVVQRYQAEIQQLATAINGSTTYAEADQGYQSLKTLKTRVEPRLLKADNDAVAALINHNAPMLANITGLRDEVIRLMLELNLTRERQQAETNRLNSQLTQYRSDLATVQQQAETLNATVAAVTAGRADEKDRVISQLNDQLQSAIAENRSLRQELSSQIQNLASATKDNRDLVRENERMLMLLADAYSEELHEGQVINPDGYIISVDGDTCYISLGAEDGVIPDLVFSVYADQAADQEGPKARLVVKNVLDESSECTILEGTSSNPVASGDLIADIAFDPDRTWTFVVVGTFDLSGGERPTERGAQQVRYLINKFGGEVLDEVSINTDFVVMGEEPELPFEPAEDAQPIEIRLYNNQMQAYEEYQAVRNEALRLNLRILNANRFLERLGYIPTKTLTYDED